MQSSEPKFRQYPRQIKCVRHCSVCTTLIPPHSLSSIFITNSIEMVFVDAGSVHHHSRSSPSEKNQTARELYNTIPVLEKNRLSATCTHRTQKKDRATCSLITTASKRHHQHYLYDPIQKHIFPLFIISPPLVFAVVHY